LDPRGVGARIGKKKKKRRRDLMQYSGRGGEGKRGGGTYFTSLREKRGKGK